MKLYYAPGACSLSPHIVLCEAGITHEMERVDLKTKKTESGKDYGAIAEKGAVPLLQLDNGDVLSEGPAIVQYLADLKPETNLIPKAGTMERVRVQEWLNYISTELHKGIAIFFRADQIGAQAQEFFAQMMKKRLDYVSSKLKGKKYLTGDQFTVADAYLFTVVNWSNPLKIDLSAWPALVEYQKRVAARPKVQEAMRMEGLLDQKAA